jgi:hypothetical protein
MFSNIYIYLFIGQHNVNSTRKAFTEGQFFSEYWIKTAKVICAEKVQDCKNVTLSRNKLYERLNDMQWLSRLN